MNWLFFSICIVSASNLEVTRAWGTAEAVLRRVVTSAVAPAPEMKRSDCKTSCEEYHCQQQSAGMDRGERAHPIIANAG